MNIAGLASIALVAFLPGCATTGQEPAAKLATAALLAANGAPAGSATFAARGDKVTLAVVVHGIPQGAHGMHLHMIGKCDLPAFSSAGGHLNPAGHQHGTDNPSGSHLGDLPNLVTGKDGIGSLTTDLRATKAEAEAALFDADGTALVIHAGPDDYRTDPSGNSGSRIACGVIERSGS